jgi:hypothetical protein
MKTMNLSRALLVAGVSLLCGFSQVKGGSVENGLGGTENAAIIAGPSSVKAWRTVGSMQPDSGSSADYYKKFGQAVLVSTNLAKRLSKVLLAEKSYFRANGMNKACAPAPGVVVTFSNGKDEVDVFFCFECNILVVQGMRSDFDPSRAKLLRIMKQIFPKDPQIQSLKRNE